MTDREKEIVASFRQWIMAYRLKCWDECRHIEEEWLQAIKSGELRGN